MSSILANFDNFTNEEEKVEFLNELLTKQIALTNQLCEKFSDDQDFHRHLQMLVKIKDSHFTTELGKKLSCELTILEFSRAFANLLGEWLGKYLIN